MHKNCGFVNLQINEYTSCDFQKFVFSFNIFSFPWDANQGYYSARKKPGLKNLVQNKPNTQTHSSQRNLVKIWKVW